MHSSESVLTGFLVHLPIGTAGSCGISIFNVLRTLSYCFLQQLHQSVFPPAVHKGSLFSTSSPTVVCGLTGGNHSERCEVISHCGFICISLIISEVEHLSYGYWPSVCPVCRSVIQIFCPFLNRILWFFVLSCVSSL